MYVKSIGATLAVCALTLVASAGAQAATAPKVTTNGAANIAQQTARLTGGVNPGGAPATFQFQYGTTSAYGSVTPEQTIAGAVKKTVTADIAGLAPATTYHYRLIAHNAQGLTKGADRTFKTKAQPLGVTFTATPNPLPFGGTTTLAGQLTGTGNGGREVVLEGNPFPYTQGFKPIGNRLVTDSAGNFSFGLMAVPLNTQYRVALPDKPSVVSPIAVVSVSALISTHLGTHTVHRGHTLTFKGSIRPALEGTPIAIQKRRDGRWITVAGTVTHHHSSSSSSYVKHVKISRGGVYRVYAQVSTGSFVPNTGSEVTIHTKR